MPVAALKSKKILGASQDGSREFISLLATICADGTALTPALIYQGESGDIQDTWIDEFDHNTESAYFAASKKGWTNESLGMSWLTKVFEPQTRSKAGYRMRLLIVGGHSSHLNMKFMDFCGVHRIVLGFLPPHSTHRLQPLDVGIFSPLATAYSSKIDALVQSSFGFSRATKRNFWPLFKSAWKSALTMSNIKSVFAATGIWPSDSTRVLRHIRTKTPSPPSTTNESTRKTPNSVRGVRRAIKGLKAKDLHTSEGMDLIIRGIEKLAVEKDILEHTNNGLIEASIGEKKRRRRGKPMGLLSPDASGQAMFFSPARIAVIREQQQELEAQKEAEKLTKEANKQRKAIEKNEKAQKIQQRKEERRQLAAEKKEAKERAKEAKILEKQANQQLRSEQQSIKKRITVSTTSNKRKLTMDTTMETPASKSRRGRNGRKITTPTKFHM